MNALSPSLSPLAVASPPPQAAASLNQSEDASDNGFSRCLDQAREHEKTKTRERPTSKDKARNARGGDAAPKADRAEAQTPSAVEADADGRTADAGSDKATAPDLAALLPGWTPPSAATPPPAAPITTAGKDDSQPGQEDAVLSGVMSLPSPRGGADAQTLTQLSASPKAADAAAPAATNAAAAQEPLPLTAPETPTAQVPTLVAATTPITTAPKTADAAPTAAVRAPLDSPAFAPSVATQVRWWAQDGVQQAQLTLNPAEMGPVTVQIALDGREARIDFRADMAATRSALEACLPALAAALDENGLTLTGGGVHDGQTPQHNARGHSSARSRDDAAALARGGAGDDREASRRDVTAARGLVDLVA